MKIGNHAEKPAAPMKAGPDTPAPANGTAAAASAIPAKADPSPRIPLSNTAATSLTSTA